MDSIISLYIAAGCVASLSLGVLWPKPEYGLFLYGLMLGFPDLALDTGAINVRLDDLLLLFLVCRTIIWPDEPLTGGQLRVLRWQILFASLCLVSAGVGIANGKPPDSYEAAKLIGCLIIIVSLPILLDCVRRLRFLVAGLMCGGVCLVSQIVYHLASSSGNIMANFQELKWAASFATWNPNTIGQAGALLAFGAGLGSIIYPTSRLRASVWVWLSAVFALTPLSLFARGSGLAIATGYVTFLWLTQRYRMALLVVMLGVGAMIYLYGSQNPVVASATHIDIRTGEGFSHRYDRWSVAVAAIRGSPTIGYGFGREGLTLKELGGEGPAHNAYLSVWIELGLIGLAMLLTAVFQYVSVSLSLYKTPPFRPSGALLIALLLTVCIDSCALHTLYWEKLTTIALAIGMALIGICERQRTDQNRTWNVPHRSQPLYSDSDSPLHPVYHGVT